MWNQGRGPVGNQRKLNVYFPFQIKVLPNISGTLGLQINLEIQILILTTLLNAEMTIWCTKKLCRHGLKQPLELFGNLDPSNCQFESVRGLTQKMGRILPGVQWWHQRYSNWRQGDMRLTSKWIIRWIVNGKNVKIRIN